MKKIIYFAGTLMVGLIISASTGALPASSPGPES